MSMFIHDQFVKVWEITPQEKFTDMQISTSEKDKDGNYVNSAWWPRCVGTAHKQAATLEKGAFVKVKSGKISNTSYTDKSGAKKRSLSMVIFEFDIEGTVNSSSSNSNEVESPTDESDTPW